MADKTTMRKKTKAGITESMAQESLHEMCSLIAESHDAQFISDFFGCLFTPAERKDFAARWLLVKEISKGTTQREIASMFNMSLCKITRGSRELRKDGSAFQKMLAMLESKKITVG